MLAVAGFSHLQAGVSMVSFVVMAADLTLIALRGRRV